MCGHRSFRISLLPLVSVLFTAKLFQEVGESKLFKRIEIKLSLGGDHLVEIMVQINLTCI